MTPKTHVPDDLLRFIDQNVESVEQLEILRVLGENPATSWLATDLARETQLTPDALAAHVGSLERKGLLKTTTIESQPACAHGPRTSEIGNTLSRLLQFYKERPVTMIQTIYARADERLKAFSDAFRLRKEN